MAEVVEEGESLDCFEAVWVMEGEAEREPPPPLPTPGGPLGVGVEEEEWQGESLLRLLTDGVALAV